MRRRTVTTFKEAQCFSGCAQEECDTLFFVVSTIELELKKYTWSIRHTHICYSKTITDTLLALKFSDADLVSHRRSSTLHCASQWCQRQTRISVPKHVRMDKRRSAVIFQWISMNIINVVLQCLQIVDSYRSGCTLDWSVLCFVGFLCIIATIHSVDTLLLLNNSCTSGSQITLFTRCLISPKIPVVLFQECRNASLTIPRCLRKSKYDSRSRLFPSLNEW